jgi:uncharacterized protein YybS (DUF2232 family)
MSRRRLDVLLETVTRVLVTVLGTLLIVSLLVAAITELVRACHAD